MNYQTVQTYLENAHRVLIHTGEDLDLHLLSLFSQSFKKKDWRGALSALEQCGSATDCDPQFWREMLLAAKELEVPRFQKRIEARIIE